LIDSLVEAGAGEVHFGETLSSIVSSPRGGTATFGFRFRFPCRLAKFTRGCGLGVCGERRGWTWTRIRMRASKGNAALQKYGRPVDSKSLLERAQWRRQNPSRELLDCDCVQTPMRRRVRASKHEAAGTAEQHPGGGGGGGHRDGISNPASGAIMARRIFCRNCQRSWLISSKLYSSSATASE